MKRPIASTLGFMALLALSACGEATLPAEEEAQETGWVMPPVIDTVAGPGAELIVTGHAAPIGRVVVKGAGDLAYAVGADEAGRFELRVPRPAQDTLFTVEARLGQTAYPAPYRLLIGGDASAPIALLTIGAPTIRLDPGPSLDAVDSDGRAAFLSGRATEGRAVTVRGIAQRTAVADAQGRWRMAGAGDGTIPITVDGTAYAPTPSPGGAENRLERAGNGWWIAWSSPEGGRQWTWFPDRTGAAPSIATLR